MFFRGTWNQFRFISGQILSDADSCHGEKHRNAGHKFPQVLQRQTHLVFHRLFLDAEPVGYLGIGQMFYSAHPENGPALPGHLLYGYVYEHKKVSGLYAGDGLIIEDIGRLQLLLIVARNNHFVRKDIEHRIFSHLE